MEKNTPPSPSTPRSVASSTTAGDARPFPEEQVHALARSYSRHSQKNTIDHGAVPRSPFDNAGGTQLDPSSPNFSALAWTETMMKLQTEDPNNPSRKAGLSFRNLSASGHGSSSDFQNTFSTAPMKLAGMLSGSKGQRIDILHDMDGLVRSGEMLVVLGPPGSGCSTFLKTISGETAGFDANGELNYEGISAKQMHHDFRGESIYTAEVDVHFPALSVGDTLYFAARARAPRHTPGGVSHHDYAEHVRDVTMAILGISHTINTNVGDDFVRGVSGGERKRVTIAEALLAGAPLQTWDNSTRGLDSATALEFCRSLKLSTSISGKTACVSLYQAPQSAYDVFDKVMVLYEGRQIYFGRTTDAKKFFTDMGFLCPERQTTADFLTSLTSDLERKTQPGFEHLTPRTPDEFVRRWKESAEYKALLAEIDEYNQTFKIGGERLDMFIASRKAQQWKGQRTASPYTLSYRKQIELCVWRGFRRLLSNPEITLTQIIGNSVVAVIISSIFYNLGPTTDSFFQRGALIFFSILMAAFASMLEMFTLYAQRNIVEKHTRYAFYHPSAEAFASMLCDLPYKVVNCLVFSLVIYFMSNLRREVGPFFFFTFVSFLVTMAMSMMFRTIASASRSISQALAPSAVLILLLCIYTGFAIPIRDMRAYFGWMRFLNPIFWAFEALMVNEFQGRVFPCAAYVPMGEGYEAASGLERVCSTVGSVPGSAFVNGEDFINASYEFYASHKWRNVGILFAFIIFFCSTYLAAAEYITAQKSKGEVLLFQHGYKKPFNRDDDLEAGSAPTKTISQAPKDVSMIPPQTAIFQWEDVVYDIKIKGEGRRILDHVDGWVKPGTLTALMGVSGAGKTTLLDVLATRVTMGVVTGKMLVDGQPRDDSFQRKTGYVQQQDLHLEISTVREALNFSALLRQSAHISREEKLAYVDEVIGLLDMEAYADAVVGVPGEGLNVEQRKRLTIGVELAAKPELLLFLDEPTSGLDSQTSWAICDLLAKLTAHGQAILCTIHQPSAMLFQRFDRLLFLAKGGRTAYFGEVGEGSHVLTKYFEKNGAHPCPADANPAEWMLEVIGAAPGSHTEIDWHKTWLESPERVAVKDELHRMEAERGGNKSEKQLMAAEPEQEGVAISEFAAPFSVQYREVQKRVFQQYWRTPSYLYSKLFLLTASALFIGFSFFKANRSRQGLQNQMFSLFMLMVIFGDIVFQILPSFVVQRSLYEARERPSKTYSWKVFMLSNIVVEIPFNAVCALIVFVSYFYPIGLWRNAEPTGAVHERGALFFLLLQQFLLFASTFGHMIVSGIDSAETASNIGNLLFILCLIFCGVLANPSTLPRFWIFMYRVSPFTYLIEGMLTTAVANTNVVCSDIELLHFLPPVGETCGAYMSNYISTNGGYLIDEAATSACEFCNLADTNVFLASVSYDYANRWRDFGLMWVYIAFNVAAATAIYYIARVPQKQKQEKIKKE